MMNPSTIRAAIAAMRAAAHISVLDATKLGSAQQDLVHWAACLSDELAESEPVERLGLVQDKQFQARRVYQPSFFDPGDVGEWFDVNDPEEAAKYEHDQKYETRVVPVGEEEHA